MSGLLIDNAVGGVPFTTTQLLGHAVRRCGVATAALPAEVSEALPRIAYLWLSDLANRGVELWTVEQTTLGLVPNQVRYRLPPGTVNVQTVLYRTSSLTPPDGLGGTAIDQQDTPGAAAVFSRDLSVQATFSDDGTLTGPWVGYDFLGNAQPTCVSWLNGRNPGTPDGAQYLLPVIEYSTDGLVWTAAYVPPGSPVPGNDAGYVVCPAGQWTCFDIPSLPVPYGASWWRLRNATTLPMVLTALQFSWAPQEVQCSRWNRDQYQQQNNKRNLAGRAILNFWLDKRVDYAELVFQPPPLYAFDQISAWSYRHIKDPGNPLQQMEMPQRWWKATVDGIAYEVAKELPAELIQPQRIGMLKQDAMTSLVGAEAGEDDKAPTYLNPGIGGYTR